MDPEQRKRGSEKFEEVMGFPPPQVKEPFFDVTLDHLFADLWTRGGLSIRERRLVTLTVISCLGHEGTLKLHMGAAVKSGDLSADDIDEFALHLAHYAGWPVGAVASGVARKLRAEREKGSD